MQLTMFHGMPRQQLLLLLGLAATGGVDAARVRGDSSPNAGANMKPAITLKGQHNSAVRNSLAKLLEGGLKSPGGGDDDDAAALLIHELMSKSGGSSSPQNMEDMIPQLLPILQGMENSTKRAHVSAQNHINSVHGRFALCHPDSNSSLSTYLSTYQSTLSSHTTCRGNEFTLQNDYTTCTQTKNNHKIAMDDKKTLFDDVNFDPTPTSDCQSPTSEGRGDYLLRLKNFFDSEYTKWSTRKHNWQIAYWTYGNLTCTDKQTSLTSKKAECDGYLRSIESNACSYAQGVKTACNSYDTCWNEAEAAYNNAKQATQEEEAAFKVHWRGVQRMKCVLTALGNGSATTADASVLEGCIAVTLYNTSHLDVTYPATPAKASCNDPTEYPCTAAYTTAVYQSLAPNTPPNVPVCNECVLPGPEAMWTGPFNTDIPGIGMGGSLVSDLVACKQRCLYDPSCEAIEFSLTDLHFGENCFTFDNQGDSHAQYLTFQIYKLQRPKVFPSGYSCESDINYLGEQTCFSCPFTNVPTLSGCAAKCNAQSGCQAFVYNKYQDCYLKSDFSIKSPDNVVHGTVSCTKAEYDYSLGPEGINSCLGGYVPIVDRAVCQHVAQSLGLTWNADTHSEWENTRPHGCFQHVPDGLVYFHPGSGGVTEGDDRRVCEATTGITPTGQGYEYTVQNGKHCGGTSITTWASGEDAGYGTVVDDLAGCRMTCSAHADCAGFVLRDSDNLCSFWKSGPLAPVDWAGHSCYAKAR